MVRLGTPPGWGNVFENAQPVAEECDGKLRGGGTPHFSPQLA